MSASELGPEGARRVARLAEAAGRGAHDPVEDVDWSTPIDDRAYHLPPRSSPSTGRPCGRR